ncbi:MAG: MFS transporter [Wenzhouxiangellaceae bacterium]|nr:MAG: MFS transporter [Wenzhouxiangellaceae bacterium]
MSHSRLERAYQLLVNEEDARVCRDIDDRACRLVPGNFFLQILTQFFTKLGDAIANPKTVLAWMLSALGAPGTFTAFLVPVRESGSLIPQLVIASYVRLQAVRKWTFALGCLLQAMAVFGMAAVALTLSGSAAGFGLIGALILFSLARGLCSVASKDVLGKTVPKTRRGRVSGWSEFLAGLVTLGIGVLLLLDLRDAGDMGTYVILLACAGGLWLLAGASYALIREFPGATEGGGNAITEGLKRLRLLVEDKPFRHFVLARSLLLCSALSAPFFIMLAHQNTEGALMVLGLFVIADGLASLVSAPVWGRFSDRSSRQVMLIAGAGAGLTGLALVASVQLIPGLAESQWPYPLFFFALAIAHAGVRLGRKTYIVDLAGGNKRTDYVAVSNTTIGVVLLLAGSVGALTSVLPVDAIIVLLAAMGLIGAWLSYRLPEVT